MPGKSRKYNVRFPPGRIKKIMQKDTEVGRIAAAVPVIISRALELFMETLLTKTCKITLSKHSRVMSIIHMKQCIESEKLFDFLKNLAEQASSMSTQREGRGKGNWPLYRRKRQEMSAKAKPHEVEEKSNNDNNGSSSVCFDTL